MTVLIVASASPCLAQSLDERLDEQRFLRGLADLQLREVLDQYNTSHPPVDDIQRTQRHIVALKLSLDGVPNTIAERQPIIDEILDARESMIAAHAGDSRRALWLIEQASDLYFLLLPTEGAGLTALFGVPSDAQREIAKRAAAGINRAAADAELAIEELLLDLESNPEFNTNIALQSTRRQLSQDERERRIPFFRGVGSVLAARLTQLEDAQAKQLLEESTSMLSRVAPLLEGDLAAQARTHWGLALGELGRHDEAMELFRAAATDSGVQPTTAFAARMGAARSFTIREGSESGLRGLDDIAPRYQADTDFFYRLLLADQRFLLYRQWSQREVGSRRDELEHKALEGYIAMLPQGDSTGADAMRRIIAERLSRAGAGGSSDAELPALVSILHAERLARDDATRHDAVAVLIELLERPDLTDDDRAAAMFALAEANERADRLLDAAVRYLDLANRFPAQRQASLAAERAARLAAECRARGEPGAADLLRSAMDVLISRYSSLPSIDAWRTLRGELALEESEFDVADEVLARVERTSTAWPHAQLLLVSVLRSRMMGAEATSQRLTLARSLIDAAHKLAAELETQRAAGTDVKHATVLADSRARLGIYVAEAQIELGQPQQAMATLDTVQRESGASAEHMADFLRTRIAARRAAGSAHSIQDEVNRLIELDPQSAGGVIATSLHSYRDDVEHLVQSGETDEARTLAAEELLPLAHALDRWLNAYDPGEEQLDAMSQLVADSFRLSEQWSDALRMYDRLARRHPDSLDVLAGQAECLFQLGGESNLAESMKLNKRISASRADEADAFYWQAELRMLQILDQVGRNEQQIAPRIDRLRLLDPQFGGEQFRAEFERLRAAHG